MRSRFGISFQREFSLLEGKERERPIQPLRRRPALVQIGNRRMMARVEVAPQPTEQAKHEFARAWAKRQNHTCAATEMGQFCGHPV